MQHLRKADVHVQVVIAASVLAQAWSPGCGLKHHQAVGAAREQQPCPLIGGGSACKLSAQNQIAAGSGSSLWV
jgi:hypothetical protein